MFRSSNRAFKPSVYETGSRRKRGMPRWMVVLFTGVIIGAGGFWFYYGAANQTNSIFQNPIVQRYDLNGDGRLSDDEMKLLMKDYNINPDEASKESGGTNVWDALGGLFSGLGNALPMGVMALFNKGGDAGGEA